MRQQRIRPLKDIGKQAPNRRIGGRLVEIWFSHRSHCPLTRDDGAIHIFPWIAASPATGGSELVFRLGHKALANFLRIPLSIFELDSAYRKVVRSVQARRCWPDDPPVAAV